MSGFHGLIRVADRLTPRRARARRGNGATGDAKEHADVHRGGMTHHFQVRCGGDPFRLLEVEHASEVSQRRLKRAHQAHLARSTSDQDIHE